VKGACTTAHTARDGLVREAEGGTLFLDDVDCLPPAAQSKLLRFLQGGEYRPVGSNTLMRADVRVIAASNCLSTLALQGRFRQDLYFRLNVLNLSLPPLRERREDIPVLALHFTHRFARQFNRAVGALTPGALRKLMVHAWPGNVRELQHVIERAVLMSSGPALLVDDIDIDLGHSPAQVPEESFRSAKARVIDNFERGYLEQLLAAYRGNVTHAARAAKKDRRAFFELMRKHRVAPDRFRVVES
jgi:DNA-binding NtrC family response regulator